MGNKGDYPLMNIIITEVTPETATVNGQELARSYVESILLPLLVASQGLNNGAIFKVAEAFSNAGLSLQGSPQATRVYQETMSARRAEQARRQAEAEAHAARCRVPTAEDIAKANFERERRNAEIRAHSEHVRSQRSSSGRSGPITGNWLDRI